MNNEHFLGCAESAVCKNVTIPIRSLLQQKSHDNCLGTCLAKYCDLKVAVANSLTSVAMEIM